MALVRAYGLPGAGDPFAVTTMQASALDSATRGAFLASTDREVGNAIVPAVDRPVALLTGSYADAARSPVGLANYPGDRAYYDWLVRYHTTLPVSADDVHRIGLAEVARIEGEMAAIRAAVGFTSSRSAFHLQVAKDPRFSAKTPEEFGDRLMRYATRLWPLIPRAFGTWPRARGDVRRLSPLPRYRPFTPAR